ncbi:MAG: MBL fold metallo-hydrolase [Alphaproteobacteria bacterium]|nr:MBL fold metallo-hydrolase [Alphaproteobacteria bacterium]
MRIFTITALCLTLLSTPSYTADSIKTEKITDTLYVLYSPKGGNVAASIGDDGTFLIDDQLKDRAAAVEDALGGIGSRRINFIMNTHYHFDHTGGNEAFGSSGAILVAHNNVRQRLSTSQFITHFKKPMPPLEKSGLPVVTFTQDMTLHYNGDDVHIVHMPQAHTDGDAIAHFPKNNVIVAGDIIFNGLYPFIDAEHGGSAQGVIAALDRMIDMGNADTRYIPGHGPVMTRDDVKKYKDMLHTITSRIETAIKDGKTRDETIATKPTQEFDAHMQKGIVSPDELTGLIYDGTKK